MTEQEKAKEVLAKAEEKAKELLEEAARIARTKLNGFTEDDRTTLNVIDKKVDKVGVDINNIPKRDE